MAPSRVLSVVAFLLATVATASAWKLPPGPGNTYCPIISGDWAHGGVSDGLIYNENNAYLGKIEDPSLVTTADCAAKCESTPKCAFWSFLDFHGDYTNDCYLFTCGVCTDGMAYSSTASITANYGTSVSPSGKILTTVSKTYHYKSGAVPSQESLCTQVKGDPHFSGADNSHFEFTGTPNTTYAMITDAHIHINMYLGGRYAQWGEDSHRPLSWIRRIGILWGHHTITLQAREGARWQYDGGYMADIQVDGRLLALARAGDSAAAAGGQVRVTWVAARVHDGDDEIDMYLVQISDVLSLRLKLRPEVANLRTPTDGVVHFSVELQQVVLSENAHGVLGQTYRRDHQDRLPKQNLVFSKLLGTNVVPTPNGKGFLDGEPEDYAVSGILKSDCKLSRFARATGLDAETARAIEVASGGTFRVAKEMDSGKGASAATWRKLLRK